MPRWIRYTWTIFLVAIGVAKFLGIPLPTNWSSVKDATTSVDVWLINHQYSPSFTGLWVGLLFSTVVVPEVWRAYRHFVLGPRIRSSFDHNDPNCDIISHFTGESIQRRFLQLRVDSVHALSVAQCSGRLIDIRGPKGGLNRVNLTLPFQPYEHDDAISKLIQQGIPEYLNVLVISEHNQALPVTYKFEFPNSVNPEELFRETGTYTLKIAILSPFSAAAVREVKFDWTGSWSTASMVSA
jgi:hypothetical protein